MDRIDQRILTLLQENSQISNQALADAVALSPSPCLRRVKQLEEQGIIQKHVALLDPEKLGLTLTVFVMIGLNSHAQEKMSHFEKSVEVLPEVIECHMITGQQADYMLKVIIQDMDHYQTLLMNTLTSIEGVNSVQSSFALKSIIDKTALPLNHLD